MYRYKKPLPTSLAVNKWEVGETMEVKMRRIISNKEQIKDNVPITYSDVKEGVLPQYNIKSDKFEIAINAIDNNEKANAMKTAALGKEAAENMEKEGEEPPLKNPPEKTSD